MSVSVAIVGISCIYPGASTPSELWENVLAQRRAFRRFPPERLRVEDYFDPDPKAPDKTYAFEAAVLEGYEFDRTTFRVVGSTYRSADLAHWLALDVCSTALTDAGYPNGAELPKETTGVILGNTLTGEFSRANLMRLRWPYVRRMVGASLVENGWEKERTADFLDQLEAKYKQPFPEVGEETLAGGLSNTIAGRICNQFDLKGGGYTVDGACASSLLAIANGCSALAAGDLDLVLAGGVDLSLDPFEIVGFAKTGALAPELMRVFDVRSAGFWPGEGCGFVVLMREEDAIAQRRHIYSVIRGWGISSDGSGGITRPEVEGQLQALRRAYARAKYGIETVEYFEGHGTGTQVGDTTELEVISRARKLSNIASTPAVIGSVKALIGHTKAAAGVAGLIKATFALQNQVLPPTAGCETPHPLLSDKSAALRILREPVPWPAGRPLRASVSAMGFGGINTHLTLESTQTERRHQFSAREKSLAKSPQDCELFLFCGAGLVELTEQVKKIAAFASRLSRSELTDLAAELAKTVNGESCRAAIIAFAPGELGQRLQALINILEQGAIHLDLEKSIFFSHSTALPKIGFLFPGQASPSNLNGGIYTRRFEFVREFFEEHASTGLDEISTEVVQPAIVQASLAGLSVLRRLVIEATVGIGHSLGELAALHWAGVFDADALLRIATLRGEAMSRLGRSTGAMAAIAASADEVGRFVNGEAVSIVGFNSPVQTVISGEVSGIAEVVLRAKAQGIRTVKLPVSHAFHTEHVAAARPVLARNLSTEIFERPQRSIVSTVTGDFLAQEADLRALLCEQVTSPVKFMDAVYRAADKVDLFIEVGPGEVLGGLVSEITHTPVISIDAGGPSLKGLLQAAGCAFVLGTPLNIAGLFEDRFTRPFNLNWTPKFLVNPCELAPLLENETAPGRGSPNIFPEHKKADDPTISTPEKDQANPRELLRQLVAAKTELPLHAITDESRFLNDLHLNSISVGQLMAEAARRLRLPPLLDLTMFANATVAKAANALCELVKSGGGKSFLTNKVVPLGVASWVRAFQVKWQPSAVKDDRNEIPIEPEKKPSKSDWKVIAPEGHPLAQPIQNLLSGRPGKGVVLCLPHKSMEDCVPLIFKAVNAILQVQESSRFVLVQSGITATGFAKTLHLEHPQIAVCAVTVPGAAPDARWVVEEATSASGFSEIKYDSSGLRQVPRLELVSSSIPNEEFHLDSNDLVLVTGGGKGIGAECALELGIRTGARLALLGRSLPAEDSELAGNLKRFEAAGINYKYFSLDITDKTSVRDAIQYIESNFSRITGVLHAAGRNVPKLIEALNQDDLGKTLGPKIAGLKNILDSICPNDLRFLITFGSIISRTGLAGEGDYALANEWLRNLAEEFHREHPQCRCLTLEWSVWSKIGMGERLGRIEFLTHQGITPITPEAGVDIFLRLVCGSNASSSLVVAGRFGEPPTLAFEKPELPFERFLEKTRVFYPGVELITDSALSSETDPYLQDHAYGGELLFPAVMGMEAMAQVAMAHFGSDTPPIFDDVELTRPVVIARDGQSTIRLAALTDQFGQIDVCLRTEQTGFAVNHFQARCRFSSAAASFLETIPKSEIAFAKLPPIAELDPVRDIYERIMFHTGRFRRIKNYRLLRARECVVELMADADTPWFARYMPQKRVLGDSGVRDAAIHAIQACIPHARLLPVSIQRVIFGKVPCLLERMAIMEKPPQLLLHAWEKKREGDNFYYDLELLGEDRTILERWENLCLRKVEPIAQRDAWPLALLAPYIERRVEELMANSAVSVSLCGDSGGDRDVRKKLALERLLGPNSMLQYRSDGKPEVADQVSISFSHSKNLTFAVAAFATIGCDLEPVHERSSEQWRSLLGTNAALAEIIASETGKPLDVSATVVWTALECLKKAGFGSDTPLLWDTASEDNWIVLRVGNGRIASCLAEIRGYSDQFVLSILLGSDRSGLTPPMELHA